MKYIGMVPARSGSKGLPGKNIKPLRGKPLIAWTLTHAYNSDANEVWLNSDSLEYLEIGPKFSYDGVKVYARPEELGEDSTTMKEVLIDFAKRFKEKDLCFVVLYPTYPFRNESDINAIIEEHEKEPDKCLIGLKKPKTHPFLCYKKLSLPKGKSSRIQVCSFDVDKFYRRQDYPDYMELTHFACVIPKDRLQFLTNQLIESDLKKQNFMDVSSMNTLNIDTQEDWNYAEYLIEKGKV